uniref:NADH-ubiquinone oxidoreductase chain 3 n=1 Tax=Cryptocelis alba TaxID=2115975 RepID=A0A2R3SK28_9PLAT|nr:NADH dehydrogenase subunit 3 [Cryptocelis alba]
MSIGLLIAVIISNILVLLIIAWMVWTTRFNYASWKEKAIAFECGFDVKDFARMPFSLRFFLLIILFLIFDVELSFLLQLPFYYEGEYSKGRIGLLIFTWILYLGAVEEWRRGILSWKI